MIGGWANELAWVSTAVTERLQSFTTKQICSSFCLQQLAITSNSLVFSAAFPMYQWFLGQVQTAKLCWQSSTSCTSWKMPLQQPLCQPPALNVGLLKLHTQFSKWRPRKWHHRKNSNSVTSGKLTGSVCCSKSLNVTKSLFICKRSEWLERLHYHVKGSDREWQFCRATSASHRDFWFWQSSL